MTLDLRALDLDRLNTLTKYPSIPTYHALDPKNGKLLPVLTSFAGPVVLTEKIDGTNTRIAALPGRTYLIGSRGEWLHARGDLIHNPALGIVDAVRAVAERICEQVTIPDDTAVVFYGEVYGGKVTGASKQYTRDRSVFGFRLFDVAEIDDAQARLTQPAAMISAWRENGGQAFADEDALNTHAQRLGVALTPRVGSLDGSAVPTDLAEMADFLRDRIPTTLAKLEADAAGQPEGLVLRSRDRATIAKARFSDYRRTLRNR
ncbi:MAG: RNA ligase family protein [Bacteroidota bacterium]